MTQPVHAWMLRASNNNELADLVEEKNAVAIGWAEMGDLEQQVKQFKDAFGQGTLQRSQE